MQTRASYQKLSTPTIQALVALDKTLENSALDRKIVDLVKIRASQLNGCLFCLDAHSKEALLHEERPLRLHHLPLWQESELFSAKEKAALTWTELLTRIPNEGASDAAYAALSKEFSEKEISDLTFVIASINAWNRVGVALRPKVGSKDAVLGVAKLGLI